jgi:hypothetical protein
VIGSNVARIRDDWDDLRRLGDRIWRRIIKWIRRAIGTSWETIEWRADQGRLEDMPIGGREMTLETLMKKNVITWISSQK